MEEKFWIFFFGFVKKKLFIKKFEKNIDFGKKLAFGSEFLVGWLVRGVENGGFGPPKRGQNGIFCSALGFCAVRDPPLGGPKTGYRGQKLIGWVKKWSKMVKNEEKP